MSNTGIKFKLISEYQTNTIPWKASPNYNFSSVLIRFLRKFYMKLFSLGSTNISVAIVLKQIFFLFHSSITQFDIFFFHCDLTFRANLPTCKVFIHKTMMNCWWTYFTINLSGNSSRRWETFSFCQNDDPFICIGAGFLRCVIRLLRPFFA